MLLCVIATDSLWGALLSKHTSLVHSYSLSCADIHSVDCLAYSVLCTKKYQQLMSNNGKKDIIHVAA